MKFPKLTKYQTVLEIISLLLLIANVVYIIFGAAGRDTHALQCRRQREGL